MAYYARSSGPNTNFVPFFLSRRNGSAIDTKFGIWIFCNKLPQVACDLCKLHIPCHICIHEIVRRPIPTPRLLFWFENTFSRHWLSSCFHSLLLVVDRVALELGLHLILLDLHPLLFLWLIMLVLQDQTRTSFPSFYVGATAQRRYKIWNESRVVISKAKEASDF